MASIVKNKVGKYTYIYESESYRDTNGRPQTRKIPIGRIDPDTELPIYRPEYLERIQKSGKTLEISNNQTFSVADIKASQILEHGVFRLLQGISEKIGLESVLMEAFPSLWEQILSLAFYIVATGDPAMYCEDWLSKSESYDCGSMSSQRISELPIGISNDRRMDFYEKWGS